MTSLGAAHDVRVPADLPDTGALIEREFKLYDPDYLKNKAVRQEKLRDLAKTLFSFEEQGRNVPCSHQIYIETKWLIEYTAEWPRADRRLKDLGDSLEELDQAYATRQATKDGSWGACYEEWFLKVEATANALENLADKGKAPQHAVTLLRPIDRPETLLAYLQERLTSDIALTGVNQRSELGAITAALSTILFKEKVAKFVHDKVEGIALDSDYAAAYQGFLSSWQDPATGYWGARYKADGLVYQAPDLSLTYHVIAYRGDHMAYWPQIFETTLATKAGLYPYGWLSHGQYNNHNNYDVVRIFRAAWPYASDAQKRKARREISKMLSWCLNRSLRSDGSFRENRDFYNSIGADYYYGVSFLDAVGYWNEAEPFWTTEAFPGSPFPDNQGVCCMIKSRLRQLDLKSGIAAAAMQKLAKNCPIC